jgi:hypothetical protein
MIKSGFPLRTRDARTATAPCHKERPRLRPVAPGCTQLHRVAVILRGRRVWSCCGPGTSRGPSHRVAPCCTQLHRVAVILRGRRGLGCCGPGVSRGRRGVAPGCTQLHSVAVILKGRRGLGWGRCGRGTFRAPSRMLVNQRTAGTLPRIDEWRLSLGRAAMLYVTSQDFRIKRAP